MLASHPSLAQAEMAEIDLCSAVGRIEVEGNILRMLQMLRAQHACKLLGQVKAHPNTHVVQTAGDTALH